MNYIDKTLNFIESNEMRDYLRAYFSDTSNKIWLRNKCAEIVSKAPACVENKIPVLDMIAEQSEPSPKGDWHDPVWLADFARRALDEEQTGPIGTVFQVREFYYHEPGYYTDYSLYYTFNAAMQYIKWLDTECEDIDLETHKNVSFRIEKFIPGSDGKMVNTFYWIINHIGEIWYFGKDRYKREPFRNEFFSYIGDMNLPVPFDPGDIVTADCRPFVKEQRVVIIEIGDNADCCCVQCLYVKPDGKLDIGAFKHNMFLCSETSHISALYRAEKYHGVLEIAEYPLDEISKAIKKDRQLGLDMWDYFFENDKGYGLSWEEIRDKFEL